MATTDGAVDRRPGGSLGPLRRIDAGDLDVGYADVGPTDGPAVLLLRARSMGDGLE